MSCRLAVAVNCYPLKWKSLERWRDLGVQGRPPTQTFKTYCCVTRLLKKNVTSRGKGRAHMSKSQVQQNTNEKESSWNEKKGTYETVFLLISSTHQIANIILDDGQFARESEKAGGRWRRGSCSLLYCGHWGKLQSSVFRLEYLTHCERHYFSLIPRVFLKEGTWDINFRSETGVKAVPFWGWWRWESRLRVALWKEKVRSVGWLCASVGERWGEIIKAKPKSGFVCEHDLMVHAHSVIVSLEASTSRQSLFQMFRSHKT